MDAGGPVAAFGNATYGGCMTTAAIQVTGEPRGDRGRAGARCPRTRAALRRPDLRTVEAPH
ncbi:hypothetical protein GCM10009661_14490 [Catellatospora chokoriensis]|uniref:Uncharacterized protein n=1 Tax=Catellatospora chokoriensis TaxID=310353 RepID=A0A8J3JY74_9ACTN|nr:hypothetical protein Cch02nite_66900 [Catellatospora chokoriensis]